MAKYYNNLSKILDRTKYEIGTILYHKDRANRLRPMIQTDKGIVDAPSYLYEYKYKLGKIEKGDCIMFLDGDRTNLSKENLIKVTTNERNFIVSGSRNVYKETIEDEDLFMLNKNLATLHNSIKEVVKSGRSKDKCVRCNRENAQVIKQ